MCSKQDKEYLEERIIGLSKDINNIFIDSKNEKLLKISKLVDNLIQEVHFL